MDIMKELESYKPKIDKEIEKILPMKISNPWVNLVLGKSSYLVDTKTLSEEVSIPLWDFLSRGGKRWRPVLMLWACAACGGSEKMAMPFTTLPELAHNGTIIADDIEDNADVRRGKPALHKLFGVDTAINDSTIVYYLPLVLIYRNLYKLSDKQRLQIYDLYCEEMLRVSVGQAIDIHWHKSENFDTNEAQYLQMCIYKTGVLARFSAKLGAILANANIKTIEALGKFGESVGLAFQIQDDILNINPKSGKWGKEIGEDISEGKKTLLVIYTLKKANAEDRKKLVEILKKHTKDKKEIKKAIEIIKKYGAIGYSIRKANHIVEDSWKMADMILPETAAKKKLRAFAEFCVNREI